MATKIGARLEAFWLAWKYVVILGLALGLSMYGNYRQWRAAITAPLRQQVASQQTALDTSAGLLADAQKRAGLLDSAAARAAAMIDTARQDYRDYARRHPLTESDCAPGEGRQDAVNRALGAQPPEK